MEIAGDAKDVAKLRSLTIPIPSKQGVVLMNHDIPSSGITHSQSKMPPCPAYRFCRKLRGPYRSPMLDSDRDHQQQITILHDLLQAIKEAALKLIELITIEERRRRSADPRICYPDSRRYERSIQPHNPESGLIATTSSSVCALCGVALHLKDSSEKSRQFVVDRERSDDYGHGISPKQLENMFLKMIYKIPSPAEKDINSDNFSIPGGVLDYIISKKNGSIDRTKGQEKVSSKTQSTDTNESGLQSKLLFIQRKSSDKIARQIRQDESQRSKLEELGLHLDSREITQTKVHGDTVKVKKTKMQKLEKNMNVKRWVEEVVQLRLQVQIEELHKNIQFFKQENEYIRHLSEKCRRLSEDIRNLQQLLAIRETYSVSGFTTTIKHLQAKYHNQHGIIATLIGMFQGSINIQQIAAKLLAPFKERWNPRENITTTHVSSASGAQPPLNPASSMVFDVY
ncbi:hypothetical protein ALC60_02944 [Trachymyrmex zeteki]|uniref:Uncharacterized protein n=1 Tax=Mycetomoellerius zeteki TaxID=64791 RepID=A0A151XC13_9HYME|nr:hypothetical protein ALC60_02944 [Trachymyrmex zeteki]